MNTDRIEEIQKETAYPDSISVQQALFKVWNEVTQDIKNENKVERDSGFNLIIFGDTMSDGALSCYKVGLMEVTSITKNKIIVETSRVYDYRVHFKSGEERIVNALYIE
jgi:hypothetical protein